MKAVVYKGARQVSVEDVPNPRIEHPADAIVKITTAAICGSDLHMYDRRSSANPGTIFEHGKYSFPLGRLWEKGVSIRHGQVPVKKHSECLRDLIVAGRLPSTDAVRAYEKFDARGVGDGEKWTKVLLRPERRAA